MPAELHRLLSDSYGRAADVVAGSASGLVAGIVGSIVLQVVGAGHVLTRATPALVGISPPAPVAGWVLFMALSLGLGLVYVDLLATTGRDPASPARGALAGAVYGLALWLTLAIVAVPLVTAAVGYAGAPPFPYVDPLALAGYLGYGVAVGVFHAALVGYRSATVGSTGDVTA